MSDDDRDDASDELGKTGEKMGGIADRFGAAADTNETSETTEAATTTETNETIETSETIETIGPDDEGFVLRDDWNGRTIYLSDDDIGELDMRYSEVNVKWQREYGEQLPKNERYYPAVVRAGLNGTSIEEELGFEE